MARTLRVAVVVCPAISQAPTRHEAYLSVLDALHGLTREPTQAERLLFGADSALTDGVEALPALAEIVVSAARDSSRELSRWSRTRVR